MINSLSEMRDYVKLKLGKPIMNVEIDDSQIDQEVEDAIQAYNRYCYGEGTFRDVLTINLSAGVSAYQLDSSIDSILEIALSNRNSINDLFTPQHQILYQQFQSSQFSGGGMKTAGMGGAYSMSNYNISMMYLKEISDVFEKKYTCQFNPNSYKLIVWPCPEIDQIGMLTVWKKETALNLYNNYHVKRLVVAKCRILWGTILAKYSLNLPGTGSLNYQIQIDRGEKEEAEVMEAIRMETTPPLFMLG